VKGGEFERAAELVALQGENLIREGYSERLLNILEEMKDPKKWGAFTTEVFLLKGRLLNIIGEWKDAIESFKKAEGTAAKEDDAKSRLEASSRTGEVLRKHGKEIEALRILKKAQADITEEIGLTVVARVYRNLALACASQANFDEAYVFLDLLNGLTKEFPDQPERADYLTTRGAILTLRGLHEEAYEMRREAVEICEDSHDVLRLVNAYNGLGMSLYHLEKNEYAFEYFDRAIKFARRIGDVRAQGYLLFNTASIFIEKPYLYRAQEYLDAAKEIFSHLEDWKMTAWTDFSYAFIEFEKGKHKEAAESLERHLVQIKKHGTPSDIIQSQRMAGELYEEMGFMNEARKCFGLALSYSEKFGRLDSTLEQLSGLSEKSKSQ